MTKAPNKPVTRSSFAAMKRQKEKIAMLTAYDYSMARCVAASDIDVILVGDSLGMVVLGYDNTLQVTMEDLISHAAAVRRGAPDKYIICDMPYLSYHLSLEKTRENAAALIVKGRANAVKLEGGSVSRLEMIRAIVDIEIPVCAHLGLTPQSVHRFGGYKVQGKTPEAHDAIMRQAEAIQEAGAFMLVLEGIPEALGKQITEALAIPIIGIGAGRYTDGQVLVYHDLLGYSELTPKFVKSYASLNSDIQRALQEYTADVKSGVFPNVEHIYYPLDEDK
ncbi:MAG: 3-methyl-2-oxobutanoate hydroxymethyltransferase [Candidatus Cloacimonetes bacterium]|nr:3-methyl-2-oxobutanoate hydroxymethyltransferase [Candidatus Cloacimonadota bacterium]